MALTREDAVRLCDEVCEANARRYFSAAHWQCWGCRRFGGAPEKRCMRTDAGGWDACEWVNKAAAREASAPGARS